MGVDLRWKDERGSELAVVLDPQMVLSRHVQSSDWSETSCLRFIDPYGNAVFNQLQMPILIRELEGSLREAVDPASREQVKRVVEVLRRAHGQVHTYAWFIGD